MPRPPDAVLARLEELIARAVAFNPADQQRPATATVAKREQWRFLISAIQTVGSACGRESPHLRELERAARYC
jgi:hypothetical protein